MVVTMQQVDYFYFSVFDHEVKATVIFKYILPYNKEKHGQERRTNYLF